jgi:hypothetical protein
MIATRAFRTPVATVRRRRHGVRHDRRIFLAAARPPGLRALFWDDRRAIRLKLALLALCVVAAGLLEVRW